MTQATNSAQNPAIFDVGVAAQSLFEDSLTWLTENYVELIIAMIVGLIIFCILAMIKRWAARYVSQQDRLIGYRAIISGAIAKTSKFFMIMIAAELIVIYSNAPAEIAKTIGFLFTISVVIQIAIWLRELILGFFNRKLSTDSDQHETLQSAMTLIRLLVTAAIFSIATIVILDNLGVDVTGLVAGLGVGGIAIGLAAQGIFSDLFAALSIIFDKPFRRGETITYDNTVGTIEKIGLKSTRLRSVTGEEIIISNTNLLDKEITNLSQLGRRRTRYGIGVVYQTPPDEARRIPGLLQKIVEDNGGRFVRSGFVGFGDSAINFELDFDIMSNDYELVYQGRHEIGLAILQKFNEEGFEFAYPTQTSFTAAPDGKMTLPYPEAGFPVHIQEG
ncbi:MAG: mechanosensitive ion channel family protein [Parasphingorhabdus sp.]|uniref:mechanosensitive ion channel family protein n=1 Tax=Parasphingorhabdus sp. TaxID=2709688 RepID=UPI0032975365